MDRIRIFFNVVLTHASSLVADSLPLHHPSRKLLNELNRAGERAAHIVAQMLSYAGKGRFFTEVIAQFCERNGRPGLTRLLHLPERVSPLRLEYTEEELALFFDVATDRERELFSTFLLTGFREQEVAFLFWTDINIRLRTIRVTSKTPSGVFTQALGRERNSDPVELARLLEKRPHLHSERFVFPSPMGNREHNMLLKYKAVAERAGLNSEKFDLKTFRSTYATRMLRSGFDVRTVQHWICHKSLETTMRYLVPASDVHDRLDQVGVPRLTGDVDPPGKSVQQEVAANR